MAESQTSAPSRSRSLSASIKGLFGKNASVDKSTERVSSTNSANVRSGSLTREAQQRERVLPKLDTKEDGRRNVHNYHPMTPASPNHQPLKKSVSIASSLHLNSGKQSIASSRAQSISSENNEIFSQESFLSEEKERELDNANTWEATPNANNTNLNKELEAYSISRNNSVNRQKKQATTGLDIDVEQKAQQIMENGKSIDSVLVSHKNGDPKVLNSNNSSANIPILGNGSSTPTFATRSRRSSNNGRTLSLRSTTSGTSGTNNAAELNNGPKNRYNSQEIATATKKPETESKCVINYPYFKVYDNGYHEHHLPVIELVKNDSTDSLPSDRSIIGSDSDDVPRQKSSFSLTTIFKTNKNDDKKNMELLKTAPFGNACSLMPSKSFAPKYKIQEGVPMEEEVDDSDRKIPKIVNPYAAVGSEELKLINTLSEKMRAGLKKKSMKSSSSSPANSVPNSKQPSPVASSTSLASKFHHTLVTCTEKYGDPVGIIGHGSYGVVRVCSRPLLISDTIPYCSYSNGKRLFFAVKVLKPKQNDQLEKFSTRVTSEFIIGHSLSRKHKTDQNPAKNSNTHINKRTNHKNQRKHEWGSPNILKIFDLMETNSTFIEVMEFCPAGDLHALLVSRSKSGSGIGAPLHPLEADCFMKQLLRGVNYMHDHGIAHCDLKPENILFLPNGLLKICDFGTSSVFQTAWEKHVHFQSGIMGSEPYVAPEVFLLTKEYDPRLIDCWSCGIVYCTMVFGHYLWKVALENKDSLYASFLQEMKEESQFYLFEDLRHVNTDLNKLRKNILYNIFQWNPEKRITVENVLQSSWMKHTRCCIKY
ncbi:Serine/threonine-protein kinase HAL5 [Nakaseomyces bracarensis]|uniref:Serine/threonine-protein kinase HAL5 n=1 Tax=Nakaseomyces bracarensis TaxID=273131 RepID=UPI003871077F